MQDEKPLKTVQNVENLTASLNDLFCGAFINTPVQRGVNESLFRVLPLNNYIGSIYRTREPF
jgi:hypothetical protein